MAHLWWAFRPTNECLAQPLCTHPPTSCSDTPPSISDQKKDPPPTRLGRLLPDSNQEESITAGFLYRAGAETPLKFRENFEFFQNDFGKFLSGGYPNRSFGIHR